MKRIQRELPRHWRQAETASTDATDILRLMDKLTLEINQLNRNLRGLEGDSPAGKTCRDMIRSRQRLHRRLSKVSPAYRA